MQAGNAVLGGCIYGLWLTFVSRKACQLRIENICNAVARRKIYLTCNEAQTYMLWLQVIRLLLNKA